MSVFDRLRDIVADDERRSRFHRLMSPAGLVTGGRISPHWTADGSSFWYAKGLPSHEIVLHVGKTGAVTSMPGVERAGPLIESPAAGDILARTLGLDDTDREVPRSYRRPRIFGEPMLALETPSPDKRWLASVRDGNIQLRSSLDGRTVPLTHDGSASFAWDIEAPRLKPLTGRRLGYKVLDPWSPDGNRLFAIKVDRRAVPDFPLVRYLKREEELCPVKAHRAGGRMDIAHPHVIDVLSGRELRLDLGNTEDHYFTLIGWLSGGCEVLFTRHSRDFKRVDVLAGNAVSGQVRTVLTERSETFVAIQHDVIYYGENHATLLPDEAGVIWRSSRSGWNHFYLYDLQGTLIRALTTGDFPVLDVEVVDQNEGWVYFMAHPDPQRPYDTHLCRVRLSGGEVQRLTPLDGENIVSISPSCQTFVAINSRSDRAFRSDFHATDGTLLAHLEDADISGLEKMGYVAPREFTVTAADGTTQLWGVMHFPADFDPGRPYPLIDHLYAGPQLAHVAHDFGPGEDSHSRLDHALAQLGYIVITLDARGTPERSKAFQDVVHGNFGRHEIADHAAAIRELAQKHAFIDLQRVGVWGHSWGGYFAIRALAQSPELFKVGVSVAPATDPYKLILHEPYLGLPTEASAAYEYASNYRLADRITGQLLLMAGTADPHIFSSTVGMVHALIQAGVDHQFVMLPEAGHFLTGRNEEFFIFKLVEHFNAHLMPGAD